MSLHPCYCKQQNTGLQEYEEISLLSKYDPLHLGHRMFRKEYRDNIECFETKF